MHIVYAYVVILRTLSPECSCACTVVYVLVCYGSTTLNTAEYT